MESKFWGAYRVARVARINDGGSLTPLSGFLSERPSATAVLQGSINAALEALARGFALEQAPVRVNAVSPGMIATAIWDDLPPEQRRGMFETTAAQLPVRKNWSARRRRQCGSLLDDNLRNWVHCSS
jgi:NAD(P)-dependent dehydrogenase (short-subunit alcohol dehydrogenase family)